MESADWWKSVMWGGTSRKKGEDMSGFRLWCKNKMEWEQKDSRIGRDGYLMTLPMQCWNIYKSWEFRKKEESSWESKSAIR